MARRETLGLQFRDVVGPKVHLYTRAKLRETFRAVAKEMCDSFISVATNVGMSFITGNAYRSFTVGIFENGKLLEYITTEDDNPTMKTLRKGQAYPLSHYYDGTPVGVGAYPRYVGEVGSGGQWGPTLGPRRIKSMRPNSRTEWNMLVIIPVEYAPYMHLNHIHGVMTQLQDLLPGMFFGTIVKVKSEATDVKIISKFKKYT